MGERGSGVDWVSEWVNTHMNELGKKHMKHMNKCDGTQLE